MVANTFIFVYVMKTIRMVAIVEADELWCEIDKSLVFALYGALDLIYGLLYVFLFLSPIAASVGVRALVPYIFCCLPSHQGEGGASSEPVTADDLIRHQQGLNDSSLKQIFIANFRGALLSQVAQTSTVILGAYAPPEISAQVLPALMCLNTLGISIMFQDPKKASAAVKQKIGGKCSSDKINAKKVITRILRGSNNTYKSDQSAGGSNHHVIIITRKYASKKNKIIPTREHVQVRASYADQGSQHISGETVESTAPMHHVSK
mmetsp:Transcript_49200/g.84551  ORF Transcript_49200/g.84551 Transcript_49200/m.84551 type:complete len:263 (+) Transcript_49200:470-1258(+)